MEILDVFNQNAFGVISLSKLVMDITPRYAYVEELGLFDSEGITQNTVAVDFDVVNNQLVPKVEWGAPGVANKSGRGRTRSFAVPHFAIQDNILASDLMGRRAPGSTDMQTAQRLTARKMMEIKNKLSQTREWMRLGVLKSGQVKDGAGNLILDIFSDLGVSQTTTSYALSTSTTDIMGKCAAVKRNVLAELRGETMSGMIALCSDTYYDAFVSHPNVKVAFQYYQNSLGQNLGMDYSAGTATPGADGLFTRNLGFTFGGVTWINYSGSVPDSAGSTQKLIEDDHAYLFPTGTSVFRNWNAPADYLETVNTEGQEFYARQEPMELNKGIKLEVQMNTLPICLKPKVIQKLTV